MDMAELAKRVRVCRAEKNWTQRTLAKKANVGLGTVQSLENGRRQTTTANIEKIAKALGRTMDDLRKGSEEIRPADPLLANLTREDLAVARGYHHATTGVRHRVLAILKRPDPESLPEHLSQRAKELANRVVRLPERQIAILESQISRMEPTPDIIDEAEKK